MKKLIKNTLLILCASTIMLASVTAFATSSTSTSKKKSISASTVTTTTAQPTSVADETDTDMDTEDEGNTTTAEVAASGITQDTSKPIPTAISTGENQNVIQSTEAQRMAEKKYASKGSIAFWFIFSIIINAILSFMIGNRFYKLARKETHVTSEIRALRRDLEEKFVNSVGGFTEMETDVTNSNDNYSTSGSINMPERKSTDFATESEDVFKKWEDRMSQRRRPAVQPEEPEEIVDEDMEETIPIRKFRPKREEENDDEYTEEIEEPSKIQAVKDKAKNILGDIFPFKED